MAGASDAHVTVAGNVYMALRNHLRGSLQRVHLDMNCAWKTTRFFTRCLRHLRRSDRGQSHSKVPRAGAEVLSPPPAHSRPGRQVCCHRKAAHTAEYA